MQADDLLSICSGQNKKKNIAGYRLYIKFIFCACDKIKLKLQEHPESVDIHQLLLKTNKLFQRNNTMHDPWVQSSKQRLEKHSAVIREDGLWGAPS